MSAQVPLRKLERLFDQLQHLNDDQVVGFMESLEPRYQNALRPFLVQNDAVLGYFQKAHQVLHPEPIAVSAFDHQPGDTIAHFQIGSLLGRGGMSSVYSAMDTKDNREVALKMIDLCSVSNYQDFLNEARIVAKLKHNNICSIRSWGFTDEDQGYIEMPLYLGYSLRDRLDVGPISESELVNFLRQVARGLASAHDLGVVHGDIKPENLFLERGGRIIILDFGIARLESRVPSTAFKVLKGTIPYLSPECITDPPAHCISDIWSLGVMAYELATGHRPFSGNTVTDTVESILGGELPTTPSSHPSIENLLSGCLVRDPARRIGTASEALNLLQ